MSSVLGVDPGSRCTGYGIIHDGPKGPVLVTYGTIRTESDNFPERLKQIYDGIYRVAKEFRPQEFAIEQVFMSKNADSALKLGQARGAAICGGLSAGLPVYEYAARAVKLALVGKGSAEKSQVQHMVRFLLGVSEVLPADASDALGVAMCHIHTRQTHKRMALPPGARR
ncbi:crossover junction endodeoxyribonuclease RuvC [Methylomagnum ishizawai]|uniref:crossover junction endodeoxyribonuclease RuvC n=1 Tax=Methylomagnum ishizawai TaxID=1760988 RepID=UPI001C3213FB|nr:crossover junction endodeoxyribonuclease RuvC [Methylomagnum ishizawai]BBL73789.1 crossover junction endodeoxyribonuclease RuvC [Methylomagnum ishizawai]